MTTEVASKPSGLLPKLPLLLALGICAFLAMDRVHGNEHLMWSFAGVGGGLVLWFFALKLSGRAMAVDAVRPVKQHYIQASVQICLYLYWGYFWMVGDTRPMFVQAPLILAQFFYLYAFDALWSWTRGRAWRFSSGPTPIVLSTNLFIWFQDDWFVWQFAMITTGLLGKEFIRWTKDGRKTHIFNPSGFGLACAATVLIVTGTTDLTWAKPLSTTLEVQHIFVVLFVLGLVVQYFFAVTLMTFAAALAMIISNLLYTEITGVYLFASTNLPAAAFLGLLLLMTDPSTSPRTNIGRTLFGLGYGFGYVVMFEILGRIGAPELYAKLYPVPILNCTIQILDRFAKRGAIGRLNDAWQNGVSKQVSNGVHIGLWSIVFGVMLATSYVPYAEPETHPGDSIAFWKQAMAEHRYDAERKLIMVAGSHAVARNSAEAYNELGIIGLRSTLDSADVDTRRRNATFRFTLAAELGHQAAAKNVLMMFLLHGARRSDNDVAAAMQVCEQLAAKDDALACYLLGLAYETGGGVKSNLPEALALYRRCPADYLCAQKGIVRLGLKRAGMPLTALQLAAVVPLLQKAAADGDGESCYYLAYMHLLGKGVPKDVALVQATMKRAVDLGFVPAIEDVKKGKMQLFKTPRRKFMVPPDWASDVN